MKLKTTRNKANLKDETALAHAMLDFVGDAVLATDTDANITYMNSAAETLTGFSRQEALGRPLGEVFRVIDVTTRVTRANLAQHVMEIGTPVELNNSVLLKARDGLELAIEDAASPMRNAKGEITGALVKFHDSRYSAETTARMAYMAQHDSLTGLLNRYAFEERFKHAAALAQRHEKKMVMLFIDLNNFKEVNDTLGHAVGDEILQALGSRLLSCVRATDHVCRHGGDEFVVLLSDLAEHEQAFAVVDKVRESAAELLRQQGHWATLTVSVGISLFPNDGETLAALLPHADAAMYRGKTEAKRGLGDLTL
ncbi:diguanylate cyclase domain-containing protein [Marinobacter sp. F4206]|uniref:diguanylate cyclase domain-containing protein n=1 Tax=Marinobacter sp. F4206 TaxID=2861777 RepID=UPI001C5EFB5A|nr:diguanylate cyclase [Marinobacter sp. F4206]MBW4933180.1 diguanylate cyclase [Marinobacter sp. F4206]